MLPGKHFGEAVTGTTKLILQLWGLSGAILHFYTIGAAFFLVGGGVRGVVASLGALCLPVISWLAVFIGTWVATGSFVNDYSVWFLAWAGFSLILLALIPLGARCVRD